MTFYFSIKIVILIKLPMLSKCNHYESQNDEHIQKTSLFQMYLSAFMPANDSLTINDDS